LRHKGALLTLLSILASSALAHAEPLEARIDRLLSRSERFLLSQQDKDGAFRSKTYGALKSGYALSPIVLSALLFVTPDEPRLRSAYDQGADFVATLVGADHKVVAGPFGLDYPVYASAGAIMVLAVPINARHARARTALVDFLWSHQLAESNGWSKEDLEYGGWGYADAIPKKPPKGAPKNEILTSNMSSTLFAAGALTLAGVSREDARLQKALVFVERCQNFGEGMDGGFFFTPTNDVQNKAGFLSKDARGLVHYRSYGTMTADGLRALIRLGLPTEHPRVTAARTWLERNFTLARVPGEYPPEREVSRDGAYYYYLWSFSHAMMESGVRERWPEALVGELERRIKSDGSFANTSLDMREDDPLIATSFAVAALGVARFVVTREFRTSFSME
jgi:hypothetical protein